MQEFQRLHTLLHAWKPSELSALNAAMARGEGYAVTAEVAEILRHAAQLSAQSDGLFNPSIGGLIGLWGFQADEFKAVLPDEKRLQALLQARPQMDGLLLNGVRLDLISLTSRLSEGIKSSLTPFKISSRNPALQLDLGGYAKGYALDRAATLLKQQGIQHALINIGGNIMALGTHGSRAWKVGIQHPRKPGALATLELHDGEAIGTSGDYQRYFELGGKRYCHLIDPRTGRPAQGTQAVTVITHGTRAGTLSDATSKPLFIAGSAGWLAAVQKMQLTEALLIDAQGVVHLTAAMRKRLEFADNSTTLKIEP
jgi:thiamine biosynthesis lipoprotein